jgi:transposase
VAERYAVSVGTVITWIAAGALRAVNVSRKPGSKRPSWRITPQAVEEFERLRTPASTQPKARRRKTAGDVIEFYGAG